MKAAKLLMEKVNRGEMVTGTLVMNQLWLGSRRLWKLTAVPLASSM